MSLLRYISHANVVIDPLTPVPKWGLSTLGRERIKQMLLQPWISDIGRVISSDETKALESADILGDWLGIEVEVRTNTGETDRSSTGYVPHQVHEEMATAFFAFPDESVGGWERSRDAQRRIVTATADLLVDEESDLAIVGHGGVGTLLYCNLADLKIHRRHDQPVQGHYWTYDRDTTKVVHDWLPIDVVDRDQ